MVEAMLHFEIVITLATICGGQRKLISPSAALFLIPVNSGKVRVTNAEVITLTHQSFDTTEDFRSALCDFYHRISTSSKLQTIQDFQNVSDSDELLALGITCCSE